MQEKKFCYQYPHPALAADCVIFGFDGKQVKILLIQRLNEPYKDRWAFPGGFMNIDETVEECAKRELEEETGLKNIEVEQFYIFSDVKRDSRERILSVAHYSLVKLSQVKANDDAANAKWFSKDEIPPLAFDHEQMLQKAKERLKQRIYFEPIGLELLEKEFAINELQNLYEAILETKLDSKQFFKEIERLDYLIKTEKGRYSFNINKYNELKESKTHLSFQII
ncbi:MAG: NUDIX hydrolase [Bacteroidales bacterium]|nr:NUDIX hydrolase [Bacteroidales bacterium]